ncbi:MAG: hypothetical protein U1E70_21045 [Acetobacteraceae bacterium]
MARDRLDRLLSVRRQAVDLAIRTLAACIEAETAAGAAVAAIDAALPVEQAAADGHPETVQGRDLYAAWSSGARTRRAAGVAALAQAQARAEAARADLAAARAAARAVSELLARRAEVARAAAARQEGHALDDVARGLWRARVAGDGVAGDGVAGGGAAGDAIGGQRNHHPTQTLQAAAAEVHEKPGHAGGTGVHGYLPTAPRL